MIDWLEGCGVASLVITSYNFGMKVAIRRIGNSLGVIVPKSVLESWGVGEGDQLELTERGLRPSVSTGLSHETLDELKRSIALAVVRQFAPREIRAQILANLHRWRRQGAWVSAYDEWRDIATRGDDGELFAAMLARDDNAVRLRQSLPFAGLLSQADVRRLHEEATG
jgi:antitoxin component of MazEF toxin-antitoxin module